MALPQHEAAVQAIVKALEPRVLGQHMAGFSCNCGAVHCAAGRVTLIAPAGINYPGQETKWYLWSVKITPDDPSKEHWSTGLSSFVPSEELEALFAQHFGTAG